VIGDTFPPEKRGSALGLIGAVFGLAFIVGPIIGGLLLMFSWHWIFAINLPIAVILILAAWRVLPTTRPAERKPFDWLGMATLAVLLASLAFGLNQIDTQNFVGSLMSLQVWPFLLLAVVLVPVFWMIEHKVVDPIIRPALLAPRQLSHELGELIPLLHGHDGRYRPANDLRRRVAVEAFRGLVPAGDRPIEALGEDRVLRRVDDGGGARESRLRSPAAGHRGRDREGGDSDHADEGLEQQRTQVHPVIGGEDRSAPPGSGVEAGREPRVAAQRAQAQGQIVRGRQSVARVSLGRYRAGFQLAYH
jgi:hypothetical protein